MPKVTVPKHLLCPIGLELMTDPVVTADGHVYDSNNIKKWLQQHKTSPMTNIELPNHNLVPCPLIRKVIEDLQTSVLSKERFIELIKEKKINTLRESRYLETYLTCPLAIVAALDTNDVELLAWLIDEGIDIHMKILDTAASLLHKAVSNDAVDVTKLFIQRGASPNATDNLERTPLFYVKSLELARLLVMLGCDPHKKRTRSNQNFLFSCTNNLEIIKWACETLRVDFRNLSDDEDTLLHTRDISTDVLRYLVLHQGMNVNAKNTDGSTPLHVAIYAGGEDLSKVKCLLELGADPSALDVDEQTPLHLAVRYNKPNCVQLLLEYGSDMFQRNSDNETPLDLTISASDAEIFVQHYRTLQKRKAESVRIDKLEQQNQQIQKTLDTIMETLVSLKQELETMKSPSKKRKH